MAPTNGPSVQLSNEARSDELEKPRIPGILARADEERVLRADRENPGSLHSPSPHPQDVRAVVRQVWLNHRTAGLAAPDFSRSGLARNTSAPNQTQNVIRGDGQSGSVPSTPGLLETMKLT